MPETTHRKAEYPIQNLLLNRWSPRAMTGESIDQETLNSLFEAARWAPSSFNEQPWRFLYAKRETPHFQKFFDLLIPFNQQWCKQAAVLAVIIARMTYEKNNAPSPSHALDTGAAWENLFLEGVSRSLVIHGMSGFDYQKARAVLNIPDEFAILAMFAVGKKAKKETLPEELQKKEVPSSRKKIEEFVIEGGFDR